MPRSEATYLRWVAKYLGREMTAYEDIKALKLYDTWHTAKQAAEAIASNPKLVEMSERDAAALMASVS